MWLKLSLVIVPENISDFILFNCMHLKITHSTYYSSIGLKSVEQIIPCTWKLEPREQRYTNRLPHNAEFFFKYYFLNRNLKYNMRNKNILKILHRRQTAGRISSFGPPTAETLMSACGRPTCMRSGQAAVQAPPFRPAAACITYTATLCL